MTINVTPSNLLLREKVEIRDIRNLKKDIHEEWDEVTEALADFAMEPTSKNKELLAEELMDLMTASSTCIVALSRMEGSPEHFIDSIVTKVHCKDYARGYNDDDMIF